MSDGTDEPCPSCGILLLPHPLHPWTDTMPPSECVLFSPLSTYSRIYEQTGPRQDWNTSCAMWVQDVGATQPSLARPDGVWVLLWMFHDTGRSASLLSNRQRAEIAMNAVLFLQEYLSASWQKNSCYCLCRKCSIPTVMLVSLVVTRMWNFSIVQIWPMSGIDMG